MTMSQSHSKQNAHNKALVRSYAKNASPAQLGRYVKKVKSEFAYIDLC